jgi:hypothetical protein
MTIWSRALVDIDMCVSLKETNKSSRSYSSMTQYCIFLKTAEDRYKIIDLNIPMKVIL